jgi:PAS domain S-box-containing protein
LEDDLDILQAVLGNITDSVVVMDKDHKVLYLNENASASIKAIHGGDARVGDCYRDCVPVSQKPGYERSFAFAMNGQKVVEERRLTEYMGRKWWYRFQLVPFYNKKHEIGGVIFTLTDINEQKLRTAALDDYEVRFRYAFEHSFLAMALVAAEGRWLRVNKTLCEIVGYTEAELMRLSPGDVIHTEDLQKNIEQEEAILAGDKDHYSVEWRLRHSGGAEEWVSGIIATIRTTDGRPLYYVWQLQHITERIKMIQRLKASEDLLNLFVEHSPAAIAMFDTDMRYIQVSRRWMTDYNLGEQVLTGKSHYEVFPTIGQGWKDIHRMCLAGATQRKEEDSFVREDGHTEWLRWEIHPWRKATGEIGGIIMMTEVITERQRMIMDLVSRNRDLNEFANMVSHTLRGPLATIMGLTNMLQEDIAEHEKDRIVEGIGHTAWKLDEVVRKMNDILNAKRMDI